jgi:ATP-dependent DNA helicase RecQ
VADVSASPEPTALRAEAEEHLRALAGREAKLREDQWEAIEALVIGHRRALVVQRTGWGKSAVYFIATALLRPTGAGPTVIVSPLLALMRNQIAAAERAGIHAATINSTNTDDWDEIYGRVSRGEVDVLLLSPERLNNPEFRDAVLPALARSCGLLVVDEVHCISDWGHDFRPDYRRLRTLLPELPAGTPVLATTATANARVVDDVAEVLGLGHRPADVLVQRGSLDRQSLRLGVLQLADHAHRLAWLVDHLADWTGSGIIYTLTVAASQDVADHLRRAGHDVLAYSGQTAPEERLEAEQALLENRIKALVATSALGMGFDKPDLEFVVHLGAPQSPIAYYQQVGRAGRATDRADVILMPGDDDEAIWKYFDSMAFPREVKVRQVLAALSEADGPVTTPALETTVDLRRSRLEAMLKVLDVDGAVRRVRGGWLATGSPWDYDADRYDRVAEVRRHEQQAMRHYIATTECRLEFLRQQLDDPEAGPCGRCDNCTHQPIGRETAETSVASARRTLLQAGLTLEPKKLWPTNMDAFGIEVRGRIDATEGAEPGRALARLTGVGLGGMLRALLADEASDGQLTDELFEAVVEVMARWKEEWPERPSAVVSIGSNRRPKLIASLARRIAAIGHLPYLGEVIHDGPSAGATSNSAHRFRSVWGTYTLAPETEGSLPDHGGKAILLVDDCLDTGWTMTMVARQLRQQGAGRVYPLVLAVTF